MRTEGDRESDNVEDQRGLGGRGMAVGGGIGTIVLALIGYFIFGNPQALLQPGSGSPGGSPSAQVAPPDKATEGKLVQFVRVVLADTEDVWKEQLPKQTGKQYRNPHLVLFTGRVQSACGAASTASGPFYCPGDEKVYIDLAKIDAQRSRLSKDQYNRLSVRLELQADFYAGVWAHHAQA